MAKLIYTEEELMAEHAYAKPHKEVGYLLHGGFDEQGTYVSPRTLHRWPAVRAWQDALKKRGFPLVDATGDLLQPETVPNLDQQRFLLSNGLGTALWNGLTITGIVEARGQILCEFTAPDFQDIIVDDVSEMAIGHLNKGLLYAHGADEGGDPKRPEYGAHDAMWFASRDLLFGKDAYPMPGEPSNIARPDGGRRMPEIPEAHENTLLLLMNVLMIEVRAEAFFSFCCSIMRDSTVFQDRRADAELAATMVERIREDEAIHVGYLQAVVSEMRSVTFKTVDGGTIEGAKLIDKAWNDMVHWHAVERVEIERGEAVERLTAEVRRLPDGDAKVIDFLGMSDAGVAA